MPPTIQLDHIAFPVSDIGTMVEFYCALLDGSPLAVEDWRSGESAVAYVMFGRDDCRQRLTLLPGPEINTIDTQPRNVVLGAMDLAFLWDGPICGAVDRLADLGIAIEKGPLPTTGGRGAGVSVYFRDPDGNLLEFITYPNA